MADPPATPAISLRTPSKYAALTTATTSTSSPSPSPPPPLEWLHRTWSVTHSTLKMWRKAQNVRITYRPLAPSKSGRPRIDDLVEYESNKPGKTGVKKVDGVDTAVSASSTGEWDWRGKGFLFFVGSHWEVLGWGERPDGAGGVERWAVTWFAKTVFTQEGVDFYSDRREGMSEGLAAEIQAALEGEGVPAGLRELVKDKVNKVDLKLPWQERS